MDTRKEVTIAISGEQASGKSLLAGALAKLLTNRGFTIVEQANGGGIVGYDTITLSIDDADRARLGEYGRTLEKAPTLTLDTPDIHDFRPDPDLLGRRYTHSGNGKVYVIVGFAWMGEDDEWGFVHREHQTGGPVVTLVRPISHLSGYREDGTPRYVPLSLVEKNVPERKLYQMAEGDPAYRTGADRDWNRRETFGGKLSDNFRQSRGSGVDHLAPREPEDWRDMMDRMEAKDFQPGDHVQKFTGDYQLAGWIVAAFKTTEGKPRFVVEHAHGVLHIYGPSNLRRAPHDGLTDDQRKAKGWRVVGVDNLNRESVADVVMARDVRSSAAAEKIAEAFNHHHAGSETHFVVRAHDDKLCGGMEDLV